MTRDPAARRRDLSPTFETYTEHDTCCPRRVRPRPGCPGTVRRYGDAYVALALTERVLMYEQWAGDADAWPIPLTYCGEPPMPAVLG